MAVERSKSTIQRALALALGVLAADQISKYLLIQWLAENGYYQQITGFFNLVMVWNRGVSFGMLQSGETGRYLLAALAIAIIIGLSVWLWRGQPLLTSLGIGAVLGGAVGNVVDRLMPTRKAVADFFDFHVFGYHWPAFNIADAAITLGVIAIVLDGLRGGTATAGRSDKGQERTVD